MSERSPMKHALVAAVAVAYVVVSLADGGYAPEAIAAGTLLIWWAVIVGLAVGAWPRAGIPRAAISAGLCFAALAALTGLSIAWASDDGRAFVELVRISGYAGLFALVVLASSRASARSWLTGLAIGLVAVAALALGSRFEPSLLPGHDDQIAAALAGAEGRLSYPIGYWNALAACMALATVLLTWLGARAQSRGGRAVAIGALPAVLLTIYLTSSRGGIAAGAAGLLVLVALGSERTRLIGGLALAVGGGALLVAVTGQRSPLVDDPGSSVALFAGDELLLATLIICAAVGLVRHLVDEWLGGLRVSPTLAQVGLIGVAALALIAIAIANPLERFDQFKEAPDEFQQGGTQHLSSAGGSGRYQFWSTAIDAFESQPIAGIGAGGYEAYWNQNGSIARVLRDAHSLVFETIAELGIVGIGLLVAFFAIVVVQGLRRRATGAAGGMVEVSLALLAAGVFSAAIDWTWELAAAFGPVMLVAGLLVGPATLRERGAEPEGGSPFGWGVATLLVGWIAIWVAGIMLLTEVKLDDSRAAEERGELSTAAQDADDAITLQPWAAEPRLQVALVQERAGNLRVARREIADAIDRAPDDWALWFVASRIEGSLGNRDSSIEALHRAAALNPRAPIFTPGSAPPQQAPGETAPTP
jgi:hypothetical protein